MPCFRVFYKPIKWGAIWVFLIFYRNSQIIAAAILGFLLKSVFGNVAIYTLILSGVAIIIAGLFCLKVKDNEIAVNFEDKQD